MILTDLLLFSFKLNENSSLNIKVYQQNEKKKPNLNKKDMSLN